LSKAAEAGDLLSSGKLFHSGGPAAVKLIGCEDRLRNDLGPILCRVGGVKLYSIQSKP